MRPPPLTAAAVQAAGRLLAPGGRALFAEAEPPPGDLCRAAAAAAAAQARARARSAAAARAARIGDSDRRFGSD